MFPRLKLLFRPWMPPLFIFFGVLLFMSWFWDSLVFADGDAFYHIKISQLLSQGIVRSFVWLPFTSFAVNYIDHHFLYHLFTAPFVNLIDPFVGQKIATMIIAAGAITLFYALLRTFRVSYPAFFTILLASAPQFMYRLSLAKVPAFSLIFLFLGLIAFKKNRPFALGAVMFFYVWAYDAWPILPFTIAIFILARVLLTPTVDQKSFTLRVLWRNFTTRAHLQPIAALLAGITAGIFINPYFPQNIPFYWLHIVKIGILNYQSRISVGSEWHFLGIGNFIISNALLFTVFFGAAVAFIFEAQRVSHSKTSSLREPILWSFSSAILAAVFLALTLKSRRNLDYSLPFIVFTSAMIATISKPTITRTAKALLQKKVIALLLPIIAITLSVSSLQFQSLTEYRKAIGNGHAPMEFASAAEWLRDHTPKDAIIFHTNWDTFPLLWQANDHNRYISGMDSTFLYDRDPERYQLWYDIVYGEYDGDPIARIQETFQSSYIFFDKDRDHAEFEAQLAQSSKVKKIYEDSVSKIFTIVP